MQKDQRQLKSQFPGNILRKLRGFLKGKPKQQDTAFPAYWALIPVRNQQEIRKNNGH